MPRASTNQGTATVLPEPSIPVVCQAAGTKVLAPPSWAMASFESSCRAPIPAMAETQVDPTCTRSGTSPEVAAVVILLQAAPQSTDVTFTLMPDFSSNGLSRSSISEMGFSELGMTHISTTFSVLVFLGPQPETRRPRMTGMRSRERANDRFFTIQPLSSFGVLAHCHYSKISRIKQWKPSRDGMVVKT